MSDTAQPAPGAAPADPKALPSFEQNQTLALLYDVSRELTAILDRDELLACIAQRVKTLVDYSLFAVMLWNEGTAQLENVFAVHYGEPLPVRFCVPLFKGITGNAAGARAPVRVDDVREDPRYIEIAQFGKCAVGAGDSAVAAGPAGGRAGSGKHQGGSVHRGK